MEKGDKIRAKRAMLRTLDKEMSEFVGCLLPIGSPEELRLRSIQDDIYRLEGEIIALGGEP